MRGHETDRLAALATELTRVGAQAEQTADGLVITPRRLRPAVWQTYRDHRMATAGALVGLRVAGVAGGRRGDHPQDPAWLRRDVDRHARGSR